MENFQKCLFGLFLWSTSFILTINAKNVSEILETAKSIQKADPQESIDFLSGVLESEELIAEERGQLFYQQGKIYYKDLADKEKALGKFYSALRYFRESQNQAKEYDCLVYLALSFKNLFHYDYAINYYTEALELEGLDSAKIRSAQYNLAVVLKLSNKFEDSKPILHSLSADYQKEGKHKWLLLCKAELADTYAMNKEYESSIQLYQELLKLTESDGDYAGIRSKAINSIGFLKIKEGQFEEAEKFLLEGLALKKGSENQQSLLVSYLNLGEFYLKTGQPSKAVEFYELGSELDKSSVNHQYLIEAFEELVQLATEKNNIGMAFTYQRRISDIQAPYVALSKRLEVLHDRYKAERVKYLNDQFELQFQLVQSRNQKLIITIILLLVAIISGIALVWQQRKRLVEKSVRKWLMEKNSLLYFIATKYNIDLKKAEKQLKER